MAEKQHNQLSGNELHDNKPHDHNSIYYTKTLENAWRNGVSQTEMGYLNNTTSGIQNQLNTKAASGANSDITSLSGLTTDLSIAQGGTGQSTAQTAIDAISQVSGATTGYVLTKDATGNATWAASGGGGASTWAGLTDTVGAIEANKLVMASGASVLGFVSPSALDVGSVDGCDAGVATTNVFKIPGSLARGDIFFVDVSGNLVKLPAGDNGKFLKTQGTAGDPMWDALPGGGDMLQATYDPNADGIFAIAQGGTGQTSAQAAIDALTQVSGATNEDVLTKDTGSGTAIWKPATGGGGGAQSFTNLLENGDFESWSAGASAASDGWIAQSAASLRSATHKTNNYAIQITPSAAHGRMYQSIDDPERYRGRVMTLGCWIYTASSSSALIRIGDNTGDDASNVHGGGSVWEWHTVTRTIHNSATYITASCYPDTSGGGQLSIFDGAILVEGSVCPAFSPKPLVDDGRSIAIDSATNQVTIDGTAISLEQWAILGGLATTLTSTELNCVDGVTSAIQTQIDAKAAIGQVVLRSGANSLTGNWNPDGNGTRSIGDATHRLAEIHAVDGIFGDMVFEERECHICKKPFNEGEILSMIVIKIADNGTHTVPVHSSCVGGDN